MNGIVDNTSEERWKEFLKKLRISIDKVLHKLAGCDEEHELLRDMLLMVLRIAEISPEDAPKVITNEVMDSLDRIKHSFNREMQNIYYNVKQIHVQQREE